MPIYLTNEYINKVIMDIIVNGIINLLFINFQLLKKELKDV